MARLLVLGYGLVTYVLFFASFLYLIGFVGGFVVPTTAGGGTASVPPLVAVLIDVGLIGLFGVQHTIMARPWFKAWFERTFPAAVTRSTFVLVTVAVLALLYTAWQPLPDVVWSVANPVGAYLLHVLFAVGFGLVLIATFAIDHFELFGLRQTFSYALQRPSAAPRFRERFPYGVVRHPLMFGFLLAFWSAPEMTVGRLVFAAAFTGYVLLGLRVEERDLVRLHGASYESYRARVPGLLPWPRPAGRRVHAVG